MLARSAALSAAATLIITNVAAQDVELFYAVKYQDYLQPSSEIVHLIEEGDSESIGFDASVEQAGGGSITAASFTPPGGSPIPLTHDGEFWDYEFSTVTLPELDDEYPSGSYTFNIQTGSGPLTASLSLTGDTYPNIPRVTNFASAQAVNPSTHFTLTWNTFIGGTVTDFIEVIIEDDNGNEIYFSGSPGDGLNGTDTSVIIPAGTLANGTTYSAQVVFYKITDFSPPGAAGYAKITNFEIKTTGGSSDIGSPWLEQTFPWPGQGDVPVESVVAFEFTEPMNTAVDIDWTGAGLVPASFSYTWSNNDTRLYAIYGEPGGLPQGVEISWELNPGGSTTMSDKANNPLPNYQGAFTTASLPVTGDPDVAAVYLVKSQSFFQVGPTPQSEEWYNLDVFTDNNTLNGITAATLTTPTTPNGILNVVSPWLSDSPEIEVGYIYKAELDQYFPPGTYQISLDTAHNGTNVFSLDLPDDNYPNTPTVTNIATMSAVDPDQPLTIQWSAFAGADNGDNYFIGIYIETASGYDLYEAPDGLLDGTSTSITIPAGTLSPGRSYEVELEFASIEDVDNTSYPGVDAVTAFSKITLFDIQTTGTPLIPTITLSHNPDTVGIDVSGEPYVEYRLEASDNLSDWFQIEYPQTAYNDGNTSFIDWDKNYFASRYYRAVEINQDEWAKPPVSIQGQVRVNGSMTPIAGAIVGTSLDSNTVTTDANGNFFLQTSTVNSSNLSYSIIITNAGYQTYNQSGNWGDRPRNQTFDLQAQ